jgi:hypothetical protein
MTKAETEYVLRARIAKRLLESCLLRIDWETLTPVRTLSADAQELMFSKDVIAAATALKDAGFSWEQFS